MMMVPTLVSVRPRGRAVVLVLLLTAALVMGTQGACDAPPRFSFAELKEDYLHNRTFSTSEVVEYRCRPGYMRNYKARNTYICEKNSWKGSNNFCLPKLCSYPGEPTNGRLVEIEQFTFGSIANYSCDTGYRLVGNSQIRCVIKDGHVTWDGNTPICEPIPCLPPPKIANGDHNRGDVALFTYGASVTYHCHTDSRGRKLFSMVGDASIFCTTTDNVNGVWNKPAPECKVVSCREPQVEHGRLQSRYRAEYTYGDTVVFDCEFRYVLLGSDTSMCQEDGSWDPPLPQCQRSSCDDPPDVQNAVKARLAGNLFPVETVITYECQTGYEFSPGVVTQNINCLPDYTWTEIPPPCKRISCPNPATKRGMHISSWGKKDTYVMGDRVQIICDPGYVFKDSDDYVVLQCTNDGTWNQEAPECIAEPRCPKPVIDHGREVYKSKNDYTVGTQVKIECDEGYMISNQESITCRADGNWFPTLPYCQQACGPPPQITHGLDINPTSSFFHYGYRMKYGCAAGLSLIGDESIYCTSEDGVNLEWSGPAPECRVVRCPKPVVENGEMVTPQHTFPYGTSVRFYCKNGFTLHGDAESHCTADGSWQPALPKCQPVKCRVPKNKENLQISSHKEEYEFNETLYFTCKQSGNPTEMSLTTCSTGGSWMPPPNCKTLHACKKIHQIRETFECGVPLAELRTLLEVQKLYLEIQKLEKDLGARGSRSWL
uniref:Sushi domain-containing protein n=1 Tax=Meleagris gallopavo TaxID=9103 RepID=G1MYD5_MELGA